MLSKIVFAEEAKIDIHKAKCFFEFLYKNDDFMNDLTKQIVRISKIPFAFQIRYAQIRIVQLENFKYTIHYRVKSDNEIIVYRTLSQSQDF